MADKPFDAAMEKALAIWGKYERFMMELNGEMTITGCHLIIDAVAQAIREEGSRYQDEIAALKEQVEGWKTEEQEWFRVDKQRLADLTEAHRKRGMTLSEAAQRFENVADTCDNTPDLKVAATWSMHLRSVAAMLREWEAAGSSDLRAGAPEVPHA